jgi:hypothetical protein
MDLNQKEAKMNQLRRSDHWTGALLSSWLFIFFLLLSFWAVNKDCMAENAEVLPKGRSAFFVEGKIYFPTKEKFGPDGDEEDIAADLNTNLNRNVFPALGTLEGALGLPPGFANLGATQVDFEYDFTIFEFNYFYGLTDNLSVGLKVPYWHVENKVDASLDTQNATFGKNPFFGLAPPPAGAAPFLPLPAYGGPGVPLTATDVQNLIGKGLDVNGDGRIDIPGYGFKKVKTWDKDGISDIETGLRYQYYKSNNWRLAVTGGIRWPTGREDDPDSLVDYPLGTGTYAGLLRLHQDYIGTKNLLLSATLKYDWYLPDKNYVRVPDDVDQPLTTNKERVDRDIGDFFELEVNGSYEFLQGLSFVAMYKYGYKWRDSVSGDEGFDYDSLEAETSQKSHEYRIALEYSTIPLFLANQFPLPIKAFVGYRSRFDGENVLKTDYIWTGLTVYF